MWYARPAERDDVIRVGPGFARVEAGLSGVLGVDVARLEPVLWSALWLAEGGALFSVAFLFGTERAAWLVFFGARFLWLSGVLAAMALVGERARGWARLTALLWLASAAAAFSYDPYTRRGEEVWNRLLLGVVTWRHAVWPGRGDLLGARPGARS